MSINLNHAFGVRSDFSIGESILQVGTIASKAKEIGYESVALTDTMTISSMVSFAEKAKKEGIKPIVGCTLRVYDDPTYRKPSKTSGEAVKVNHFYQLKVYVKDDTGLASLLKLLSKGNSEEYFYYHSRVGLSDVMALENVVVSTGDMFNAFHHPDYVKIVGRLAGKFATYIELVPVNSPLFDTLNERALALAYDANLPLIASYPAFYAESKSAGALDVLRAISTNTKMDSMWLPIPFTRDFQIWEPKQMVRHLHGMALRLGRSSESATIIRNVSNSMQEVANACTYEFKKLPPCLPKMDENEFLKLVQKSKTGWTERFSQPVLGHKPSEEELPMYRERLAYELSVLKKMDFSGYFLLVQDIVNWAKENGVLVGPGRGSVGGSLIAYLLGITDVDPIRFKLLFERFINPDRIDLPDADLDFMSSRRHEVIAYITEKYGADKVAGVSNYTTLGPASAIRDVSRMHDLNPFEYACSKQVEKEHGVSLSLVESVERVPDIAKFKVEHPEMWEHILELEGVMRGLGQHAAGVVVSNEPLVNRAVVETRTGGPVVNWDKSTVESWGLIKMDILGLSSLDILKGAADYIAQRHGKKINFLRLPLDEPDVMAAFGRGETVGIFQFESNGMRKLLKDLALNEPLTFEDITAATALYRPGPIDAGLVDQFVAVKQGLRSPHYEHVSVEESLKPTHGVLTYQEQIMQVCRDLAGFSMAEADGVRKAMGKKDKEKMALYRDQFIAGAVGSGMTDTAAGMLWDKIEGFAAYAFNRSHSVEYSVISYWMMWLKVRYPAEFFAATMSVVDKEEKLAPLVMDARRVGLSIAPPDINHSSDRIEIAGETMLYMPFQAIKGISGNVAGHIMTARRAHKGTFESKADFEATLTALKLAGKVNKSHREKLERVGAFASVEPGTPPALHSDRLKDRLELMPGFTVDAVKADRQMNNERLALMKIVRMSEELRSCDKCSLAGAQHPLPRIGKKPVFMVVSDSPHWQEGKVGKMLEGETALLLKAALRDTGISANDGYFTALVKSPKPAGVKMLTNESIINCSEYLKREIDILKPPVIVAMGSNAIRFFAPGMKGNPSELAGKVIYDPKLDASIVFGLNPAQVSFDPSKVALLQKVCEKIAELIQ